jgi:hypothetical protein
MDVLGDLPLIRAALAVGGSLSADRLLALPPFLQALFLRQPATRATMFAHNIAASTPVATRDGASFTSSMATRAPSNAVIDLTADEPVENTADDTDVLSSHNAGATRSTADAATTVSSFATAPARRTTASASATDAAASVASLTEATLGDPLANVATDSLPASSRALDSIILLDDDDDDVEVVDGARADVVSGHVLTEMHSMTQQPTSRSQVIDGDVLVGNDVSYSRSFVDLTDETCVS